MYKIYKIKDVRLERAPFPIRSFHLSFYWKLLVGSDRIGKTSDPVRSTAYFPVWKLTLNKTKNKLLNKIRPKIAVHVCRFNKYIPGSFTQGKPKV